MTDTPGRNDPVGPEHSMAPASHGTGKPRWRHRRGWRIAAISATAVVVLVGATVVAGLAAVTNLAGHIQRVHVASLDAAQRPAGAPPTGGLNVLITGAGPTGSQPSPPQFSGLIDILHINADKQAGGDLEFQPNAIVPVPGHGRTQLRFAMKFGGPSLLVRTLEHLTHLRIQFYARISFNDAAALVNAIGGVDVATPSGTVHLNGPQVVAYAKNPSLSESGRVLRQSTLVRAIGRKIVGQHLLTSPITMIRVLRALTGTLTLSSNFTNTEIVTLARALQGVSSHAGTFVTVPYRRVGGLVFFIPRLSHQLYEAARLDMLAQWARQHPRWVVPEVVH